MNPSGITAVTGTTGRVGSLVARALSDAGVQTRLVGRDPSKVPAHLPGAVAGLPAEYADTAAMRATLEGVDTLFMVSGRESGDRVGDHRSAITAALEAGVQRVVYTSFLGAAEDCTFTFGRDHFHTEVMLEESGMSWLALRDAFYQDVLPTFPDADGVLRGPAGDGAIAAVAVDDVAEAAVAALGDESVRGTIDLSGPQALTLDEVAAVLAELSGAPVRYERETPEQAYASRAHLGASEFELDGWVSTYTAIAAGEMAPLSDGVQRLTGHAPRSLRETLERHPELLDGLRA